MRREDMIRDALAKAIQGMTDTLWQEVSKDDVGWPWCESCRSWHHPDLHRNVVESSAIVPDDEQKVLPEPRPFVQDAMERAIEAYRADLDYLKDR